MHDFSGMADAGGMGYPPSPLIGPWPRVFGCGAGVFKRGRLLLPLLWPVTFSPACRGGGFLLKNPSGFSIDRLSPHALWFARFMSRATR